jgi:hypothetical protein
MPWHHPAADTPAPSPRGLMDKALPSGGRDCGFESRLGLPLLDSFGRGEKKG